jgi:hypothetical protein
MSRPWWQDAQDRGRPEDRFGAQGCGGFYTKEVDIARGRSDAIIEPILILALGGGVGLLVAAIIMPIYQMTEAF